MFTFNLLQLHIDHVKHDQLEYFGIVNCCRLQYCSMQSAVLPYNYINIHPQIYFFTMRCSVVVIYVSRGVGMLGQKIRIRIFKMLKKIM